MAFVRCSGGNNSKRKYIIFKDGVTVAFDNPGTYKTNNSTVDGRLISGTISSSAISFAPTSGKWYAIGISNAIDLTNYSELHIKGGGWGISNVYYCIGNSKNITGADIIYSALFIQNTHLSPLEYVVDLSSIAGSKYIYVYTDMAGGSGGVVNEIWLE